MTKKFWTDWQKRIGETKNILLNTVVYNKNNDELYYNYILSNSNGDKILKASFHDDSVDLIIERHKWVFGKNCNDHWNIENEYLTLKRNEIASIKFIKY